MGLADSVFRNKKPNLMTPDIIECRECREFVIELSKGFGVRGDKIWGVTVLTHEGESTEATDELCRMFKDENEAYDHIEEVIAIGGGSVDL